MAYVLNDIPDLISRKEFYSLKSNPNFNYKNLVDNDPLLKNRFQLRAHQLFIKNLMNPNTGYKRLHLEHATGLGKCHGWGTGIRMFDGTVKEVQDIVVGDELMGDEQLDIDPVPRVVLSLARGRDMMIKVKPNEPNTDFICNLPHLLTLSNQYTTIDVPISDYIEFNYTYKYYKLFRPTTSKELPTLIDFRLEILGEDDYYGFTLTGNGRYLLKSGIVTHNTLCGLAVANEYIRAYKYIYNKKNEAILDYYTLQNTTPTVFILGFGGAKEAFIKELLSRPFLGYISEAELEELNILRKNKKDGNPRYVEEYKKYMRNLKKRIRHKKFGGFFKFYGYDEFVNRLFYGKISLSDIEKEAMIRHRDTKGDNFDIIAEKIESGDLYVNENMMQQMEHSLIIADEIHETYNTYMKNNRGLAIQYILDKVKSVHFLSMSATPMTNSPSEIIDLLNYLQPTKLYKKDFFTESRYITTDNLEKLGKISAGKFSYVRDSNVMYYPTHVIQGSTIKLNRVISGIRDTVPYLKFIECPMSEIHQKTYFDYAQTTTDSGELPIDDAEDINEAEYVPIPISGYSIMDMVFPGINGEVIWKSNEKSQIMGEFKNNAYNVTTISGDFLLRNEIAKYSSKYSKLLTILHDIILSSGGDPQKSAKCLIYHNNVEMTGVILIQELLLKNGFINEYYSPVDNTLCMVCGDIKANHSNVADDTTKCLFYPARFTCVYGSVDKTTISKNLEIFDSDDNVHGHKIMILIGSKIIKQSYDFKAVQHLIVTSLPTNISTLIQVFGRVIRTRSHAQLPVDQHNVNIYILLSTINIEYPHTDEISPELYRYIQKLSEYQIIQKIEQKLNEYAIDGYIHRDIIMPQEYNGDEISNNTGDELGPLYYKPIFTANTTHPLDTFFAYDHAKDEIKICTFIIKYLFYTEPIWTYDDLWAKVRDPPVRVEVNPELFLESSFTIALYNLTRARVAVYSELSTKGNIFNSDQEIYRDGKIWKIHHIDKYYILFPILEIKRIFTTSTVDYVKDKERTLIDKLNIPTYNAVDAEMYKRINLTTNKLIPIKPWVYAYEAIYLKDLEKFKQLSDYKRILTDMSVEFQSTFVEKYILFSLEKALGVVDVYKHDRFYNSKLAEKTSKYLSLFGMMIQFKTAVKYKNIEKRLRNVDEIVARDLQSIHIGYESTKYIRIYDGLEWININKVDMNYDIDYKENDIIVGTLEPQSGSIIFKLRSSLANISTKYKKYKETKQEHIVSSKKKSTTMRLFAGDHRVLERGIACETKQKKELISIALSLGIDLQDKVKTYSLCVLIRDNLITRELEERSKRSILKYMYFWWNSPVVVISRIN